MITTILGGAVLLSRAEYQKLSDQANEAKHWRNLYQKQRLEAPTGLKPEEYAALFPFVTPMHYGIGGFDMAKNARTTARGGAEVNMTNMGVFDVQLRRTIRIDAYLLPPEDTRELLALGGCITGYDDYPSSCITFHGKFQVTELTEGRHTQATKLIAPRNSFTNEICAEFEATYGDMFIAYAITGDGKWLKKFL